MKKLITVSFAYLLLLGFAFGQSPESDPLTYRAYLDSKDIQQAKSLWKKAVTEREEELKQNPSNADLRYRLVLAQFGLVSMTMRDEDESLFDEYADLTVENLELLITQNHYKWEATALLAAYYGLQMGYSSWKGMYLGPKSSSLMDKAIKNDPSSPLIWKLYGNAKLFTPEIFGGDTNEAIEAYLKALELYENGNSSTENNWCYIDTIAFLGQAYARKGANEQAIKWYKKALSLEPDFSWITYALLPSAESK